MRSKKTGPWGIVVLFLAAGAWGLGSRPARVTAEDEHEHGEHEHEGHDHGTESSDAHEVEHVRLSERARAASGIETAAAGPARLRFGHRHPAEITLNEDRVAHIVSRTAGIVREVNKVLGSPVEEGEVLAVLDSREFSETRSAYVAAARTLAIARAGYERESTLLNRGASSEKEVLEFRRMLVEAENARDIAEQRLRYLGMSFEAIGGLPAAADRDLARLELRAPFSGTVVGKHITRGEVVHEEDEVFLIADLSTVWLNVTVYAHDLPAVREGQTVMILGEEDGSQEAIAEVAYIVPLVNERTRAALARCILPNPDRTWRPGMFVDARVVTGEAVVPLTVPVSAIVEIEGIPTVFLEEEPGHFEARPVRTGRSDGERIEILAGIEPEDRVVTANVFILKAEIGKGEAGHAH